jgi:hypothetical protein
LHKLRVVCTVVVKVQAHIHKNLYKSQSAIDRYWTSFLNTHRRSNKPGIYNGGDSKDFFCTYPCPLGLIEESI